MAPSCGAAEAAALGTNAAATGALAEDAGSAPGTCDATADAGTDADADAPDAGAAAADAAATGARGQGTSAATSGLPMGAVACPLLTVAKSSSLGYWPNNQ